MAAASDNVVPPDYLPTNLKTKFKSIAHELLDIGIMTNLDNEALARYIISEANYQKVSKKMLKTSLGDKSIDEFDPTVKIARTVI